MTGTRPHLLYCCRIVSINGRGLIRASESLHCSRVWSWEQEVRAAVQVRGDSGTHTSGMFLLPVRLSSAVICLECDRYAYSECQCVTAPLQLPIRLISLSLTHTHWLTQSLTHLLTHLLTLSLTHPLRRICFSHTHRLSKKDACRPHSPSFSHFWECGERA